MRCRAGSAMMRSRWTTVVTSGGTTRPTFGRRAKDSMARSMSAASFSTGLSTTCALGFLTVGMGFGAAALVLVGLATNRAAVLSGFGVPQWIAGVYLGIGGGALAFILWVLALQRAPRE